MASFKNTIITKKGHALMAKTLADKTHIEFVDIKTSDQEFVDGTDLEAVETLESIRQIIGISDVKIKNDTTVEVSGVLSNKDLTEGYYCKVIALYAKDQGEDIIYSITVANQADWVPADTGTSATSILFNLVTAVSNASAVSLDVDPTMFATVTQINELNTRLDAIDDPDTPIDHVQTLTSVQSLPDGALDGAVSGLEIEGLSLVNMIQNGDFSEGANDWIAVENGASSFNVSNNEATIVGKDYEWVQMIGVDKNIMQIKTGDKLFLYAQMMSDNASVSEHRLYIDGVTSGDGYGVINKNSSANVYNEVYGSFVKSGDHEGGTRFIVQFRYSKSGALNSVNKIRNFVAINMTALGIENYTEDQMLTLVRGGYIEGLQGVSKPSVKMVGKNLLDNSNLLPALNGRIKATFYDGLITLNNNNMTARSEARIPVFLEKGETYYTRVFNKNIISGDDIIIYISEKGSVNNLGFYNMSNFTFNEPTGVYNVLICTGNSGNHITKFNIHLQKENPPSTYLPYQSASLLTNIELRSLPNGVKDRIYLDNGNLMLEKKIDYHTFKAEDFENLFTGLTNNDLLETVDNVFNGSKTFNTEKNDWVVIEGTNQVGQTDRELSTSIGSFHTTTPGNGINFIFNKGKYSNLESAVTDYVGRKAFYLLATPEIINLTAQGLTDGILESIKGGTCIVESDTFIPPRVSFGVPADLGAQMSSALASLGALSKSLAAKADRVQEKWYPMTLLNGWVNFSEDGAKEQAEYMKDSLGFVHLKGMIKGGVTTKWTKLTRLPEGYRPRSFAHGYSLTDRSENSGIAAMVGIDSSGYIYSFGLSDVYSMFDNISFKAER